MNRKYRGRSIASDCAITTAACENFAPYLFAMLASLEKKYPDHPVVYVYDLGLKKRQKEELRLIPWVKLIPPVSFSPHWRECYSWKPYLYMIPVERYRLHLDAGCIILKPLNAFFVKIMKSGYLLFDQGQLLGQIIYPQLWNRVGLSDLEFGNERVFAAGIFGFDSQSPMGIAVHEAAQLSKEGWALGYSECERHRGLKSVESIIRDCNVFRHDQSLINVTARKQYSKLTILSEKHIPCSSTIGNKAFVWHCRKNYASSIWWFYLPISGLSISYIKNRICEFRVIAKIVLFYCCKSRLYMARLFK